jgi:proteasome accessory factor A
MRAGDSLLEQAARDVAARQPGLELVLYRANVDYSGSNATWGSHESVLHRVTSAVVARNLIPHLVTRIVYCGAGGLNPVSPGIDFTLSPRARFVKGMSFSAQGGARAFFHGKNEPLGGPGLRRLQVVSGESLCSQWADYLRVGTTALIVALIDAGMEVGARVQMEDAISALQQASADVGCRATLKLAGGRGATALQVQRQYLAHVTECLDAPFMPGWAAEVCRRWEVTLKRLEQDPTSLWDRLDWPLKLTLFRDRAARRGFTWERVEQINREVGRDPTNRPFDRDEMSAFGQLRRELFEVDTRFSQLGPTGIFAALDSTGLLKHGVVTPERVERLKTRPPLRSRARQRASVIRRLAPDPQGANCHWTSVVDPSRNRVLELRDPWGRKRPRWRAFPLTVETKQMIDQLFG